MEDSQAGLARLYVEQYLRSKSFSTKSLRDLPEEEARRLMVEASTYAALKLAEVETRAHMMGDIHGNPQSE
jgi:hypothetical protein